MCYNDQQTYHLLIWINHQSKSYQSSQNIYSFNQICQSTILSQIITQIHPQFFSDILNSTYNFNQYLIKIQQYLLQFQDLTIKQAYKKTLLDHEQTSQILKLTLFLLLKSTYKQQIICRILQLQQQTQQYLMTQLQKMQKNVQYKTKIKDIIYHLQQLQGQNEFLTKKFKQQNDKYHKIIKDKHTKIQQYEEVYQQYRYNNDQKTNIMSLLSVTSNKEYLQIYNDIQKQYTQLCEQYQYGQQILRRVEEENKDIEQKMEEDSQIIQYLNQEIKKYKNIQSQYKSINYQIQHKQYKLEDKQNMQRKDKQYMIKKYKSQQKIYNQSTFQQSYMTNNIILSQFSSHNTSFFELDMIQNVLPFPPGQINQQIHEYKTRISVLDNEISYLKQLNEKIENRNKFNQQTLSLLKSQYQQFHLSYQFCISTQ